MKSRPVRRPVARKPRVRVVEPVRPAGVEVKITPAKGRPMLTWVGKRPLSHVTAFPAQHIETFDPAGMLIRPPARAEFWKDWPAFYPKGGLLFHGDNKEVLAHLLANGFRGRVHLIYIDPPFDSGADYVRKISLRGPRGTAKLDGEGYTLGEQIQYSDIWANDNYLQFMYERLLLLKELLSDEGSIYLHSDWHRSHHLRAVMDEVFGAESFRSEIVWQRVSAHANIVDSYGNVHDSILYYGKSDRFTWNTLYISYSEEHLRSSYRNVEEGTGRRYALRDITAPIVRASKGQLYAWKGILPPANRCWVFSKDRMEQFEREGRLVYSSKGYPRLKVYLDEMKGVPLQTIWTDVLPLQAQSSERTEFPTQKSEELLERILKVSSSPGDIVLDCFIGSGTIAAVAERFGRRWIGCDINKGAIQTTGKRLQTVILEQMEASSQGKIIETEGGSPNGPPLAQLAFTVWRVNDYDLTIQHNEAVNLACEHIGVQRTRTDTYFDGTLGKSLVKIIPFDHPLSPVDLEELRRELDARPDEDRPVTLVCLGIELAAQVWIEEWNRLRKGKDAVNRIDVIELRTDPKYGKFIKHEPARARVKIARRKDKILVEIEDFISPTIIERLQQQAGILSPKIDDWRAMVDVVMIDPAYDGQVFNVALSDVPERKSDLVSGRYELPAPRGETTVAVKVIDMLGEEVLVTATV